MVWEPEQAPWQAAAQRVSRQQAQLAQPQPVSVVSLELQEAFSPPIGPSQKGSLSLRRGQQADPPSASARLPAPVMRAI